ncbi:hypothetical protein ALI22I_16210 [Saccharothrix sp. ALI-22-I]|uniref:hypothetical protein n=1 Tax=Saccharothrix sp. ALI-22-I TaxID=1933778 RepID=UPI00097C672C|nr:hypothetical protein [Saccharothrix sp. ALI-22-I]ONI89066.1 hypothetical protein ALI22I_16210 [Saccharothrix sp. ALI-22-I]
MTRLVGVVALVIGAALTLVGTFLPLYTQVFEFGGVMSGETVEMGQDSWGVLDSEPWREREARYGVPMVVAVVLIVLGAAFTGRMWGRLAAISGAMLLTGSVWLVGQQLLALFALGGPGITITTELGLGSFTLAAATLVVLVGALLVQDWPPRAPKPDPGVAVVYRLDDDDTDTPPFGFPVVLEEEPRWQPERGSAPDTEEKAP